MRESKYLKANEENIRNFLSIPVLKEFDSKDLEGLLKVSKIRHYESKEIIIKEGEKDSRIFFLLSGKIGIFKDKQEIAVLKRMGDLFGEMSLVSEDYRSASVYALEKVVCLTIETDYIEQMSNNEKITFCYILYKSLAQILSTRLKETDKSLAEAKAEIKSLREKMG